MELLVAMLIFTISLTAIMLVIRISINYTSTQILLAREAQATVNDFIIDVYARDADGAPENPGIQVLTFIEVNDLGQSLVGIVADPILAAHNVIFGEQNSIRLGNDVDIVSFHPVP